MGKDRKGAVLWFKRRLGPSASISSYGKWEGWAELMSSLVLSTFAILGVCVLEIEVNSELKLYCFWRETYLISLTCPQEIVPHSLVLLNAKTRIATSDSCHPRLRTDSVKMAKTPTSARGTKPVGF